MTWQRVSFSLVIFKESVSVSVKNCIGILEKILLGIIKLWIIMVEQDNA